MYADKMSEITMCRYRTDFGCDTIYWGLTKQSLDLMLASKFQYIMICHSKLVHFLQYSRFKHSSSPTITLPSPFYIYAFLSVYHS